MPAHKRPVVDRLLVEQLGGREKLKALLLKRDGTIQQWARRHGFYPEQVTMTLSGAREYPEVRDEIARDLGIERAEIDTLIGSEAA